MTWLMHKKRRVDASPSGDSHITEDVSLQTRLSSDNHTNFCIKGAADELHELLIKVLVAMFSMLSADKFFFYLKNLLNSSSVIVVS